MALQVTERDAARAARREAPRARQPRGVAAARISGRMPAHGRSTRAIRGRSGPTSGAASSPASPPGSASGFVQANLAVLPRDARLRLPALLPAQPAAVPAHRGDRRGLAGAGGRGAGRRSAHGHPALPHLQGRRAGRRGHRRHARSGATTWSPSCSAARSPSSGRCSRPASRSGTSSRARTWRCGRPRSSAGRPAPSTAPWSSRCGRSRRASSPRR